MNRVPDSAFREMLDGMPMAIITVAASGRIVFANAQAVRLFGYTREQLDGESIDLLMPDRFRTNHPSLRQSFVDEPKARPMGIGRDLFGLHRDGSEIPIEIGLTPIHTDGGLLVVSAIIDLRERKRLEELFRSTVDSAPTAMLMVDGAGTIVLINNEIETLFGYEREELLGKKMEVLVPERYAAHHPDLRAHYLSDAHSRRMGAGRDLYARRKDGGEFPVEIGLNPIKTEEGRFVLAAVVDLTERKRVEAELRAANDALVASNLELQQFAYVASHDLQEPLRTIRIFSEFLQREYRGKLDETADMYVSQISGSAGHMHSLVGDLLSIARVESRARTLKPVSLEEVFESSMTMLATSIADAGATVTSDRLPCVVGDAPQLTQLLSNLIGNSIKYRGADSPKIHVSSTRDKDRWTISVTDNGIGIEPRYFQKIFEIFRRLHASSNYPGTGIGLAVCRRIVQRHDGEIWVESVPGEGSVFSFTLKDATADSQASENETDEVAEESLA